MKVLRYLIAIGAFSFQVCSLDDIDGHDVRGRELGKSIQYPGSSDLQRTHCQVILEYYIADSEPKKVPPKSPSTSSSGAGGTGEASDGDVSHSGTTGGSSSSGGSTSSSSHGGGSNGGGGGNSGGSGSGSGNGGSGGGGGGGGGSGSSGGSGDSDSGSSSSSSSGGGDGGSNGGGSGSSSSGGSESGGGGTGGSKDAMNKGINPVQNHRRSQAGIIGIVGAAVIIAAVVATASIRRSSPKLDAHPLKGSLDRRMKLFSQLAVHMKADRPPRSADYYQAPDGLSSPTPASMV